MATFAAYAQVLTPDDPTMKMFAAGIMQKHPGEPLADLLERSGGQYEAKLYLPPRFRERLRQVGKLTSDQHLLAMAEVSEVPISLEHLRDVDPQTRIVVEAKLTYAPGESERLGLGSNQKPDPKTTILYQRT
jgi:hypothetical protein